MLPLKCAAFFTTPQGPSWGSAPPAGLCLVVSPALTSFTVFSVVPGTERAF